MRILFISLLLSLPYYSSAKENSKSRQLFTINYSYLRFMNKVDVRILDGTKNFLHVRNTNGYMIGGGYEYTNKYNLTFSANIFYGIQNHDFTWNFNFDNFDPNVKIAATDTLHRFTATNQYLAHIIMIGYNLPINAYKVQLKAGLGNLNRFGINTKESWTHSVLYSYQPGIYNLKQFAHTDADAGTEGKWFTDKAPFFTLSVNAAYVIKSNIFKEIGLGLQYIQAINKNGINSARSFYFDYQGKRDGIQVYNNRFRSVSVTVKVGF